MAFFAVGWFQTLFLYNSRMPSDTIMWLWDNWVTERSYKVRARACSRLRAPMVPVCGSTDVLTLVLWLFPHYFHRERARFFGKLRVSNSFGAQGMRFRCVCQRRGGS